MTHDIFTRHYRRIMTDGDTRAELVADPKRGLERHFGAIPDGDYRIEIVEERDDTITILLPAPPRPEQSADERLAHVEDRIYDILHTSGVGGYLIPDAALTWVLRDMRALWAQHAGERV